MPQPQVSVKRIRQCLILVCIALITGSCSKKPDEGNFDPTVFNTSGRYNLILCFDLRNDNRAIAGIVISGPAKQAFPLTAPSLPASSFPRGTPTPTPTPQPTLLHSLILPFDSSAAGKNPKLLSTWSSYKDFTIINYIAPIKSEEAHGIGIVPRLGEQPQRIPQIEDLKENVYLLQSGLERRFIYKYSSSTALPLNPPNELKQLPRDIVDAIGVAIPSDAQGIAIRNNLTAIPNYLFDNGRAQLYPAYSDGIDAKYLEVKYAVQPTKALKIFGEVAPKIILAIIIPLLELIFLSSIDIHRRKTRLALIWGGIILQVIILILLLWSAISIRGEFQEKAVAEMITVAVGALFSGFVFYIKKKPSQNASKTETTAINKE